jgi:hypothetical protein
MVKSQKSPSTNRHRLCVFGPNISIKKPLEKQRACVKKDKHVKSLHHIYVPVNGDYQALLKNGISHGGVLYRVVKYIPRKSSYARAYMKAGASYLSVLFSTPIVNEAKPKK